MMGKIMRQVQWSRVMVLLLVVWLAFLLVALGLLRHEPDQQINQRISQALRDLQSLHNQREEISKLISEYSSGGSSLRQEEKAALLKSIHDKVTNPNPLGDINEYSLSGKDEPPIQYEKLRRRLYMGVNEMWFFLSSQLKSIQKDAQAISPLLASKVNRTLEEGIQHKRSLIKDVSLISNYDGYAAWRIKEAADLSDLVQRRLKYLQNPKDCSTAKKLLCDLNKGCGYGCQLHHAVYCLIVAYGTERTLILRSKGWRYNRAGWEQVFLPISDSCSDIGDAPVSNWPGNSNSQVIMLGIVDSISPRPPILPLAVPKDLSERISRIHGDPIVWWVGQFLKYLLRPQPDTTNLLSEASLKFNIQRPMVGVHIRRTDKVGTEAAFHSVDEYMLNVEEYYKQVALTQSVPKKRIYLASDDPKVFTEIKIKYPDYEVLGDPLIAKTAAVATRYSDNSLNGIVMDIYFLSLSDYLVCTFSSQVCRVAYEIMQTLHPDAAARFRSLDDIYYYGGQGTHRRVAVLPHKATSPDQMDLEVGDIIGVAGNHWDGYSKGRNLRTNKIGLYPSFKVDDIIEEVEFPAYKEVPLQNPNGT